MFWELPIAIISQIQQVQMCVCNAEIHSTRSDIFPPNSLGWKRHLKVTCSPVPSCNEHGHVEDIKATARHEEVF